MKHTTVVIACNRELYFNNLNHLINNNDIEVILVGPIQHPIIPTISIQCKPAQAWAIGAHHTKTDKLCFSTDDCIFTPGFFEAANEELNKIQNKSTLITAKYIKNNIDQLHDMRLLGIPHMPLLPVCGVMWTSKYHELGGIDRRFNGALWDTDLAMRCLENGGETIMLDSYTVHEDNVHDNHLYSNNKNHDLELLKSLWFINGQPQLTRNNIVQSYSKEELQ